MRSLYMKILYSCLYIFEKDPSQMDHHILGVTSSKKFENLWYYQSKNILVRLDGISALLDCHSDSANQIQGSVLTVTKDCLRICCLIERTDYETSLMLKFTVYQEARRERQTTRQTFHTSPSLLVWYSAEAAAYRIWFSSNQKTSFFFSQSKEATSAPVPL